MADISPVTAAVYAYAQQVAAEAVTAYALAHPPSDGTPTPTPDPSPTVPTEAAGDSTKVVNRWVGRTTPTTTKIKVKTTGVAAVKIKMSTASDLLTSPIYSTVATPDADGFSEHVISGLVSRQQYFYGVVVDGALVKGNGTVKPFGQGAHSFKFGFSSCLNASSSTVWSRLQAKLPDMFVHLGDFWYDDGADTTKASYLSHYDAKLAETSMNKFFATVPTAYVWSDHDFGMANNAVGSNAGRANAQAAYRQRVPYWEVPDTAGAIYQTFVVGRVRFIITDDRSYKSANDATDNSSKTVLGATQKAWFKQVITNATEPVIIWASDQPWIGSGSSNDDDWFAYDTERTELGNFFTASGKNIQVISGDMHAGAYDDGTNSKGHVVVNHAAALNNSASIKGGPYTAGTYPTSAGATIQQYATIEVTDTGTNSIIVTYTLYDTNDVARIAKSKTYSTDAAVGGTTPDPTPTGGGTTGGDTTGGGTTGGPTTTQPVSSGIWRSKAEIMAMPMSGAGWAFVLGKSDDTVGSPHFDDNNWNGDATILAKAIVGTRMNNATLIAQAKTAIDQVPSTPTKRALEFSRNVPMVVQAMDILQYKPTAVMNFFNTMRTSSKLQGHDGTGMLETALNAANNWGSMSRGAMVHIDLLLGTHPTDLKKVANTHLRWLGATVPNFSDTLKFTAESDWATDSPKNGINKRGAKKDGHDFGGIQPEDQRRTGGYKVAIDGEAANGWPANKGHYPWESLQGVVTAAVALDRAGLVPFNSADFAIRRAGEWLTNVNNNPAEGDDLSTPYVMNFYGASLPASGDAVGKCISFASFLFKK